MDLPEPPRVVFEQPAVCSDASRADALLRRALAPSVAPHGGWTVTVRMTQDGASTRAEGEITDESDAPVAHRVLERSSRECSALARAVGVWASLVLDAEVERARTAPPVTADAAKDGIVETTATAWPAPAAPEPTNPDARLFTAHAEGRRTFEVGVGSYLMGGTGSGVMAGPSLFAVVEAGGGWFLRPQLTVGRTVTELHASSDVYATWGAMRVDACKRLPGNYLDRRGIQLDLCAGSDLGFLHFDAPSDNPRTSGGDAASRRTLPFLAVGPTLGLRGELGGDLSVMLRLVTELNVLREGFRDGNADVDPGLFIGRIEVGLSWSVR